MVFFPLDNGEKAESAAITGAITSFLCKLVAEGTPLKNESTIL
jgi:hypothetical protein